MQALADVELSGQVSGDAFGAHLSTGDHNDDGYTDLGVSATYAGSKRGYAYFYNGTATGWSSTLVPGDAEATVRGPTDSEMSPLALDGDINDDGFDDLVIGAPQTPTTNTKGRVYFLQGPLTGTLYASVDRVGVWTGEANGDQATYFRGLVSAGDVNGDGYADTLVGAPYHNTVNRGAAYLMLGGPNY